MTGIMLQAVCQTVAVNNSTNQSEPVFIRFDDCGEILIGSSLLVPLPTNRPPSPNTLPITLPFGGPTTSVENNPTANLSICGDTTVLLGRIRRNAAQGRPWANHGFRDFLGVGEYKSWPFLSTCLLNVDTYRSLDKDKMATHRFDPDFTDNVIKSMGPNTPARFREVMTNLIRHLHDFARESNLTVDEWMTGVNMINWAGQMSDDKRNEGQLLCDVLGLESYAHLQLNQMARAED